MAVVKLQGTERLDWATKQRCWDFASGDVRLELRRSAIKNLDVVLTLWVRQPEGMEQAKYMVWLLVEPAIRGAWDTIAPNVLVDYLLEYGRLYTGENCRAEDEADWREILSYFDYIDWTHEIHHEQPDRLDR